MHTFLVKIKIDLGGFYDTKLDKIIGASRATVCKALRENDPEINIISCYQIG